VSQKQVKSKLGFGVSGPHGASWFTERKFQSLIEQAVEGGIRRFDTAGFYGDAEIRLGRVIKGVSNIEISTKTGTRRSSMGKVTKDFSEAAIRTDVELSLMNLKRERLDLLYLHGPSIQDAQVAVPTIEVLKAEGKIAAAGVCSQGRTLESVVKTNFFDAVMAPFNLSNRAHLTLFEYAKSQGMEVASITPLAQALYQPGFFRIKNLADAWKVTRAIVRNRDGIKSRKSLRRILEQIEGWRPSQAALGYVLAQDSIDYVFTTTSNPHHLTESLEAASRLMFPETVKQLELDVDALAA